jgi:hypothetical protein
MERKIMSNKVTPEIIKEIKSKINSGVVETEIRKWFRESMNLRKSRANELFLSIKKTIDSENKYQYKYSDPAPEVKVPGKSTPATSNRYTYDTNADTYTLYLKSHETPLIVTGAKHRAICRSYSQIGENLNSYQVCAKYNLTPKMFNEYKTIFNLTKLNEPLSDEEVNFQSVEDNVSSLLEDKRFKIFNEFTKKSLNEMEADATKWKSFQLRFLDPVSNLLESWTPPAYKPYPFKPLQKIEDKTMLINVADIHVGAKADGRFLYRQKNWNSSDLAAAMKDYSQKIVDILNSRQYGYSDAVVTLGGDIIHTLTGHTDKGTKLNYEFIEEDQVDFAFSILVLFIENMLSIFPTVSVKSVSGNHSSLGDYVVAKMLEIYFKSEDRIHFEITNQRYLPFKIHDSLFILDHGSSFKGVKSKLPNRGSGRNSYIQSILLARPELLTNINQKYFITNDKHHFEYEEHTDFEMILCPSIVGGDRYSDLLGFGSRASQCVFTVDNTGIKEIIKLYF